MLIMYGRAYVGVVMFAVKVPFVTLGPTEAERKKTAGKWYLVWRKKGRFSLKTYVHETLLSEMDRKISKTRSF